MGIQRFRKKPEIFEGIQWTGDNISEISAFLASTTIYPDPYLGELLLFNKHPRDVDDDEDDKKTTTYVLSKGDWILKEGNNVTVCANRLFEKYYQKDE